MLLQTNSYIVPAEKRVEHQRLLKRFRQAMIKLGCDSFDTFEQVGPNWAGNETTGRFVQIMRFRDHQHQRAVQAAERSDPTAQALIAEFCDLINLPYQQQQGLFAIGFYRSVVGATGAPQQSAPAEAGQEDQYVQPPEAYATPAAEEQPMDPQYGVQSEQEQPHEPQTASAPDFVDEILVEPQGDGQPADELVGNDPPSLDEFDIESIAEEEIGGFDQSTGDAEQRRRQG